MWKNFTALFVMILIAFSCGRKAETDHSFSEEEYRKTGMPDPSVDWKLADYRQAFVALSQLKMENPHSLPRKKSARSGRYFSRMINRENLSFLRDGSLSLQEKAMQIQSYILVHNDLTDLYTDLYTSEQYYNKELVDLYIFGLYIMQEMLQLSQVINESDDVEAGWMKSGLPTLRFSYVSLISYILDNQKNGSAYKTEDLERLADSLYISVKTNSTWMEENARATLAQQIRIVMDSVASDPIHQKYNDLVEILSVDQRN
jgi:hypothetical protein